MKVLDVFICLLAEEYDEACRLMPDLLEAETDEYNNALYALSLAISGKEPPSDLVSADSDKSWEIRAISAVATLQTKLAEMILAKCELDKMDRREQAIYHALRFVCASLVSNDSGESLRVIERLLDEYALLALGLKNYPEVRLFRLVWSHLVDSGHVNENLSRDFRIFWRRVDAAKSPELADLPARDLAEPLRIPSVTAGSKKNME